MKNKFSIILTLFFGVMLAQDCDAVDSSSYGDCTTTLGYGWNGSVCVQISGCNSNGDSLFNFYEECQITCELNIIIGDTNFDQEINILDVVSLVQYVLGNINYLDQQIEAADFNLDQTIDILDIVGTVSIILQAQDNRDTWEIISSDILSPKCGSSCHVSGEYFAQLSGLILTDGQAYNNMLNSIPSNNAANADGLVLISNEGGLLGLLRSFFWEKINIRNESHFSAEHPYYGEIMPMGGPYLTNGELNFIEKWIWEGAPETGKVADPSLLADINTYEYIDFEILEPPSQGIQLHMGPFNVETFQEREIFYYIPPLDDDIYIRRVEISMREGSHHFILHTYSNQTPSVIIPNSYEFRDLHDGFGNTNMSTLIQMNYQVFITGTQWPYMDYTMPEGVALKLPNTFGIDMNSHYLNYTDNQIEGEVYVNLHTVLEDEVDHVAEIMQLGNTDFEIPPGEHIITKDFSFNEIVANSNLTNQGFSKAAIFQLFTHAHRRMTRFDVEHVYPDGTSELIYTALDWEHPPILQLNDSPIVIEPGHKLRAIATYFNETNDNLYFGFLSEDEMMIVFGYIYGM